MEAGKYGVDFVPNAPLRNADVWDFVDRNTKFSLKLVASIFVVAAQIDWTYNVTTKAVC